MNLKGKKLLVLGLSKEGLEAVKTLAAAGAQVMAYAATIRDADREQLDQNLPKQKDKIVIGGAIPSNFFEVQGAILSGARQTYQEILEDLAQKKVPVLSPLEFVLRSVKLPLIAITGTNGKSTVAKWTEEILTASGKTVFLGGGTFDPYLKIFTAKKTFDLAVLVLGSSTLQELTSLAPTIAVLTNLVPAHLERHESRSEYFKAKAKVFSGQSEKDVLIYNADNEYVVDLVKEARSHRFPFYLKDPTSYSSELKDFAYAEKKVLYFSRAGQSPETYLIDKMPLKGQHQVANALSALSAARWAGATPEAVQSALTSFTGLPHRMQRCLEKGGLTFYDDSRASNPAATAWGLTAFREPVILLMGGLYTGATYKKLTQTLQKRVKLLILFGEARRQIFTELKGVTEIFLVNTLEEAISLALQKSHPKDTIVLSPASPPDPGQYSGYEGLGNRFCEILEEKLLVQLEKKRLSDSLHPSGIKI